jgi:hypothetical protein
MGLYWSGPGYEEHTIGVYDGEGAGFTVDPTTERLWFIEDVRGTDYYNHLIYFYVLIVEVDPATCDTTRTIRIPGDWFGGRGLAYQWWGHPPHAGPTFWYTMLDSAYLYHVDESGTLKGSYPVEFSSITGLAVDVVNEHLWAIVRGDPDVLVEYDVSTGVPVLIQGPFAVDWSDGGSGNAAGLDYCYGPKTLVAVNASSGTMEFFRDLDPAYDGSGEEPGVNREQVCQIADTPEPYGIACAPITKVIHVAGRDVPVPFPLDKYSRPSSRALGPSLSPPNIPVELDLRVDPREGLQQNLPNPFAPSTQIVYTIPSDHEITPVTLRVYDPAGRLVRTLVDEGQRPGIHRVDWDGRNDIGNSVKAGIYFYKLQWEDKTETRRMTLLR